MSIPHARTVSRGRTRRPRFDLPAPRACSGSPNRCGDGAQRQDRGTLVRLDPHARLHGRSHAPASNSERPTFTPTDCRAPACATAPNTTSAMVSNCARSFIRPPCSASESVCRAGATGQRARPARMQVGRGAGCLRRPAPGRRRWTAPPRSSALPMTVRSRAGGGSRHRRAAPHAAPPPGPATAARNRTGDSRGPLGMPGAIGRGPCRGSPDQIAGSAESRARRPTEEVRLRLGLAPHPHQAV